MFRSARRQRRRQDEHIPNAHRRTTYRQRHGAYEHVRRRLLSAVRRRRGQIHGGQLVRLMGRIRGVPESNVRVVAARVIDAVGISKYAHRPVNTYSGGTKRRLSLALALVGGRKCYCSTSRPPASTRPRAAHCGRCWRGSRRPPAPASC